MTNQLYKDGTLGIEVIAHEKRHFQEEKEAYVLHYKILNRTAKRMEVHIDEAQIINDGAQYDKDDWLTGTDMRDATIIPGAYIMVGAVFLEAGSRLLKHSAVTSITVTDITNGYAYSTLFRLGEDGKWFLLDCEVRVQHEAPNLKNVRSELQGHIERIESMEEKLGVIMENISVKIDDADSLEILGEISAAKGDIIDRDIKIKANLYNEDNEIIGNEEAYITQEDFMGYDTFQLTFYQEEIALRTKRVKVYVTKW
ncbi:MAG: hypothetical protein Q4P30_03830 [Eubacteriales bacterium]|nr:hypothetical protein [Eubacteriales bacterium]